MHRYREVHMKRSKRESFCGCVCYLRGKWGICGTRDGGRGGGRQEEGTSGAALCIGGMETEEDEGLTTKGMLGNEVEEMEDVWRRGVDVVFGEMERRRNRYSDKG
ncbi:uncharacterized protein MONOS_18075 [Monocercomonoides exilis]|uniref:uncharacterized protein n=1 Tax=Monocercomonoides exilis TaxID=2049356 RepID=UPI00355A7D1B|nr:hypothetical protein MONOS_18075 [Monocercomonoides exilis]